VVIDRVVRMPRSPQDFETGQNSARAHRCPQAAHGLIQLCSPSTYCIRLNGAQRQRLGYAFDEMNGW
jgi:hypothetical protein